MSSALVDNKFLQNTSNFISHNEKEFVVSVFTVLSLPEIIAKFIKQLKLSLKTFLILDLCQYRKNGSTFPQVCLLLLGATAANKETPFVCACPSDQPKLCLSTAPRAGPLIWRQNL